MALRDCPEAETFLLFGVRGLWFDPGLVGFLWESSHTKTWLICLSEDVSYPQHW